MEKTKEELVEELGYQAQAIEEKDKRIGELEVQIEELSKSNKTLVEIQDRRINELNQIINTFKAFIDSIQSTSNLAQQNFDSQLEKITK